MDPRPAVQLRNLHISTNSPSIITGALPEDRTNVNLKISDCQYEIKRLKRRVKYLTSQLKKLNSRLALAKQTNKEEISKNNFKQSLTDFINVIRKHNLQFNVKTILNAFLLNSQTPEDVILSLQKSKTLSRVKSGISKIRYSRRFCFYTKNLTNLNRIFPRKQCLLDNKQSLSVVFDQNVLKKVTNSMLFFHLPLNPDLNHFTIKQAHFDGKFTNCPRPYKQSVELKLVLIYQQTEITVTLLELY